MLEGITILNQSEIMAEPRWAQTAAIISAVLMIVFFFASIFLAYAKEKLSYVIFSLMIISAIAAMIFVILGVNIKIPTGKYEYQTIIDDDVSLNEFNERYEIIDIDGNIYTIKEKED